MSYAQPLLLLGASGQLGSELRRLLDAAAVPYLAPDLDELDLTSSASLAGYLAAHQPALIINAAAYTAVDKAESECELAEQLNHLAPAQLAQWAAEAGLPHPRLDGLCLRRHGAQPSKGGAAHGTPRRLWPYEARRRGSHRALRLPLYDPAYSLALLQLRGELRQDDAPPDA